MNSQEMETAVRLRLNVVILVLQDDAYGMIRWKQQVDGFPDFGMTFGNPDFAAYARAHYAKGSRVQTADGLVPALEGAFREGGVHLIAAPIDYTENIKSWSTNCEAPHWIARQRGYDQGHSNMQPLEQRDLSIAAMRCFVKWNWILDVPTIAPLPATSLWKSPHHQTFRLIGRPFSFQAGVHGRLMAHHDTLRRGCRRSPPTEMLQPRLHHGLSSHLVVACGSSFTIEEKRPNNFEGPTDAQDIPRSHYGNFRYVVIRRPNTIGTTRPHF